VVAPADSLTGVPVDEEPRALRSTLSRGDSIFRNTVRACGLLVLVITGSIGVFLGYQAIPTLHHYGFGFFTRSQFIPELNEVGILSAIVGTIVVAVIALVIAFPIAVLTALYISDYAPGRLRSYLISLVDLMAAIPSIIYGAWGAAFLMPHLVFVSRWLDQWFGWTWIFRVPGANPSDANFGQSFFDASEFDAAVVVALMVIPLACSVMRNVFAQTPIGEKEGAYALGSTRAGMIRTVVLPFGRGGIIGGTMLGLGRALGETVAVLLILSANYDLNVHFLRNGGVTISSLIATRFGEATGTQLASLLAAGFVLFLMTLLVNTIAGVIVSRSRSGAGVDA